MTTPQLIIIVSTLLLLILWGVRVFYRHLTRVKRRLHLLLDAIDSADTTLRFPTSTDTEVNTALNRIAQALSDLRSNTIETEKFYKSITDTIATGIIVSNRAGHILRTNPAALHFLDRPAITRISSLQQSWPELHSILENHTSGIDTTIRNLAVRTIGFITHTGETLLITTLDDISAQLAEANVESWIEMSRVLTHEIMNGIAPVVSIAETLRLRYDGNEEYMLHGLDAISESTAALKEFVGNYKRLTTLPPPEPTDFDLHPFLERAIELASATMPDIVGTLLDASCQSATADSWEKPHFSISMPNHPVTVRADRNQMMQVLTNLLKNAIEAGASRIAIRVSSPDSDLTASHRISIDIENNGSPISSGLAARIFTPFFTTKQGGTGIGLSLSRRIISANGGSLTLTSPPDSTPTRFTLSLPLHIQN